MNLKINKSCSRQQGFTLIELLVVVLIIGVLASVALPQYQVSVEKSRAVRAVALGRALLDSQERYALANGTNTADIDELDVDIPYTTKSVSSGKISYKTSNATFSLYTSGNACVIGGGDWAIDLYKRNASQTGVCYGYGRGIGERVCRALGPKVEGRTSSAGTAVYEIKY